MKNLTKQQLEVVKERLSIINGLYKASYNRLAKDNKITAGELRRYNSCLNEIREVTKDNEFINFSVSIRTSLENGTVVDGTEFNSRINQFFEYIKTAYNLNLFREIPRKERWVYYTNPFWFLWRILIFIRSHKIISFIVLMITLLTADYSMGWKNIKTVLNFIRLLF